MKLFVVEVLTKTGWIPRYLHRGEFRRILKKANLPAFLGIESRVRRVKTPAEQDQYLLLNIIGDRTARTEWVN